MENEKYVVVGGFELSAEDFRIVRCVLEQYIFEEEHLIYASGEIVKLDRVASWGSTPLAPIAKRLKLLGYSFDSGDSLLIKKSRS